LNLHSTMLSWNWRIYDEEGDLIATLEKNPPRQSHILNRAVLDRQRTAAPRFQEEVPFAVVLWTDVRSSTVARQLLRQSMSLDILFLAAGE